MSTVVGRPGRFGGASDSIPISRRPAPGMQRGSVNEQKDVDRLEAATVGDRKLHTICILYNV